MKENSDVVPVRFSTDDVSPKDRTSVLREVFGRVHVRVDIEPLGEEPVRATFEQHPWSSVSLAFAETTAISVTRSSEMISDGNGDFRLTRADGAPCSYVSRETCEYINSGDAMLLSNGAVGTLHYRGSCRISSIRIGRDSLLAAVPRFEERAIRRIAADLPPRRLLFNYMEVLRRGGPTSDPVLAHRTAQHLIDLVALMLEPTESTLERTGPETLRAARLATIRADVLANLPQARLSAKTVAQRHGISERYVHLLFEETGQTFSRFVEDERLRRAYAMLTDPMHTKMRIGDIASKVGIIELSTFNRAFRRRFGDTPRGVRFNRDNARRSATENQTARLPAESQATRSGAATR